MRRISGIFCTRRSVGFYWMGGTVCSLEGVEVKGWMRGRWARGPKRRPERSAVVTCSRSFEWSTFHPVIYFSRSWLLFSKNKRAHFQKYLRNRTNEINQWLLFVRNTMSQLITIHLRDVQFDVLRNKRTIDCVKFLCVAWWEFITRNHDCQEKKERTSLSRR